MSSFRKVGDNVESQEIILILIWKVADNERRQQCFVLEEMKM